MINFSTCNNYSNAEPSFPEVNLNIYDLQPIKNITVDKNSISQYESFLTVKKNRSSNCYAIGEIMYGPIIGGVIMFCVCWSSSECK